MSYSTPHTAREYLKAACLSVCHDYSLRCQHRNDARKKLIVSETREIDLCSKIASFFGASAHLAAQGTDDIDLIIDGPTIRAEVKYFLPPAVAWTAIRDDWDWLLAPSNANNEFDKRAWIAFFPSISWHRFTACLSVTKGHGNQFSLLDFAPFTPFTQTEMPANGTNQRLCYKPVDLRLRDSVIQLPGGKRVRVEIVGDFTHPIWCAVYTRIPGAFAAVEVPTVTIDDNPIQRPANG